MKLPPFIVSESYVNEYGSIDYKGKKVLDLGAEYGSTAEFFLENGASEVIAVEGNKVLYEQLVENAKWLKNVTPIFLFVTVPSQLSELIETHKPDVVKCDLDGYEIHLFNVPDDILSSVKEYTMEVHSMDLLKMCLEKFLKNGYQILEFKKLDYRKASTGIFRDGILISFVRPTNYLKYFDSIQMLFKYWEFTRRKD